MYQLSYRDVVLFEGTQFECLEHLLSMKGSSFTLKEAIEGGYLIQKRAE